jgi:hypothetical protein
MLPHPLFVEQTVRDRLERFRAEAESAALVEGRRRRTRRRRRARVASLALTVYRLRADATRSARRWMRSVAT